MRTSTTTFQKTFRKQLTLVVKKQYSDFDSPLHRYVASDALAEENPHVYLKSVIDGGLSEGTIKCNWDIKEFFDKYYDYIEEIRVGLDDDDTELLLPGNIDLRTCYVWMAYEYVAVELFNLELS